jgi:hypothetical protein
LAVATGAAVTDGPAILVIGEAVRHRKQPTARSRIREMEKVVCSIVSKTNG